MEIFKVKILKKFLKIKDKKIDKFKHFCSLNGQIYQNKLLKIIYQFVV
jgi:hypothetical protein